ncbi:site-specific DNA-methyltransferase [uncultured Marinobacter sp.]|uniref:site-specific DNA-methyltransferase n=1 Tax=uncultured Marinobacter sp. TaxID=187379 RepID=UPI0025931DE4|nr:site-specific DNA-methyltransferase [uncultured Marinobacter sp.]
MSHATQQLKAQQRRQKFADLLREMFQLNQPELDFGLYRIMHARKDDVNRFIEKDLPSITQKAFQDFASQDKTAIEKELQETVEGLEKAKVNPETNEYVQELKAKLRDDFDLAREEGEVYDALLTFFSRYYNEGDFLSRRVYKDGTYAIPYQGEEVVLHWANKDQYYIKSSETLRDYSFRLNPDAGPGEDPMRVHFKLVDGEAGAKDNNKESADSRRVFVLDVEDPFELIEGEATEHGEQYTDLQCRFMFRPATESDWTEAEKKKATAAAQKKPPTQDALRAVAEERLLGAASDLSEPWKSALAKSYRKADGSRADYSMLAGQLNNYTKKNTFDYFIHKDLGGFLTRELDFYIKNELLDWSDIASLKNDTARLAPLLSKIDVIRSLGEKIIAFLSQLENFQKKLWLKKKFVTEANYCITLDRLEDQPELLAEAFNNEHLLKDWERLYKIDLGQLKEDRASLGWGELLAKPEYRYMMVDTVHFGAGLKEALLAGIDDLDEQCNGLLVNSDNFQALNMLKIRYSDSVKCAYIDPPYNTGGDGFLYKDGYQHSSWQTLIAQSNSQAKSMLKDTGTISVSVGIEEHPGLSSSLSNTFGEKNRIAELVWEKGRKNDSRRFSIGHDYILVWARNKNSVEDKCVPWREPKPGIRPIINKYMEIKKKHGTDYKSASADLKNFYAGLPKDSPAKKYARSWHVDARGIWRDNNITWPGGGGPRYDLIHPITGQPCKVPDAGWRFIEETMKEKVREGFVEFREDHTQPPIYKSYLYIDGGDEADNEGVLQVMGSVFYRHSQPSNDVQKGMFGSRAFENPKDHQVLGRLINYLSSPGDVVLDYFAGSGSTAHAIITELNLTRKYLLVEMGEHFRSLVVPRVKKASYSSEWESEIPKDPRGISHFFKYMSLESYEDALGNLTLNRASGQQQLLNEPDGSDQSDARQAYVMNYLLEVETRDSKSLLNTRQFLDPNQYELNVRSASGDETQPVNVDLLETFNYLLGLKVEHIAAPIHFEAELNQGEYGRWQAKVKRSETGKWWFRTVYGTNRTGQQVLVVWRNLPSVIDGQGDGIQKDNAVLDAVLIEKLSIRLTESQDDEIDVLYVNGDHNISIPRSRKGEPMEQARIQLIEEAFHRLMFADTEAVH